MHNCNNGKGMKMADKEKPEKDKILPKTVDEAVQQLLKDLPIREKYKIDSLTDDQLYLLHFGLGMTIRNDFGLWGKNKELIES